MHRSRVPFALSIFWRYWMPLANSAIDCSLTLSVISWRFCSDSTRDLESDVDCLESTFKLRFGKVRLVQGDWFLEGSVQEVGLGLVSNNVEIKRFPRGRLSTTEKFRNRSLPVSFTVQPVLILSFLPNMPLKHEARICLVIKPASLCRREKFWRKKCIN